MKTYRIAAAAAVLLLAACSTPQDDPPATQEPPVAEEATSEATTEPPEKTTDPVDPLAACDPSEPDTGLAAALTSTPLPDSTVVKMVQEVRPHSDEDQSNVDVIVYLCTTGLTDEEHRVVATDLAITAMGEGATIGEFHVDQYVTDGDSLEQGPGLSVDDFGMYTWDRDAARAPETIWEA